MLSCFGLRPTTTGWARAGERGAQPGSQTGGGGVGSRYLLVTVGFEVGLFKVDFWDQIKGQLNYLDMNLNQIKGQIKYLGLSLNFYHIKGFIKYLGST